MTLPRYLRHKQTVVVTLAVAAFAGLVGTRSAEASIPPSYRVLVVSGDRETLALSEALVQFLASAEAFFREAPTVSRYQFRACLEAEDFGICARPTVPRPLDPREAHHVVIKATRVGPAAVSWTCVGSGAHRPPDPGQTAEIQVQTALFGEGEERSRQLRTAMACIQSAAAESVRP